MARVSQRVTGAKTGPSSARRKRVRLVAVALLVTVVAGAVGVQAARRNAAEKGLVVERDTSRVRHMTTPVRYDATPPSRGDHHPVWWNCGTYDRPLPAEHVVHSLEHGAVWLTYRPDVASPTRAALTRLADRPHLLLSPLPDQRWPVVVTAWGTQLRQREFDEKAVKRFIVKHRKGPQAPEPGAPCTGGTETDLVRRP
ncbi:MAG: DUF3105 domain-containing protein [Dermatophilaceae bacterium]